MFLMFFLYFYNFYCGSHVKERGGGYPPSSRVFARSKDKDWLAGLLPLLNRVPLFYEIGWFT